MATRRAAVGETDLLSCDASFHVLSGSIPARSCSMASRKMPRSWNVVYSVSTPIMMKYVGRAKEKAT